MSLTISPARIVEESASPLLAAPDSWPRRPLGEVAAILNGFAFPSNDFTPDDGMPLIRIRDISRATTSVRYRGAYDSRYLVQPGELLVGMDGEFNCARWRGSEALLNQRVCKIIPDADRLEIGFLIHLLPAYLQAIHDVTSSTTVTHLSSRDVAQIPIPLPTIEEQRALARLFDATTSKRCSSTGHLATAHRAIERFRQAVLAAACSGRLTADWREEENQGDAAALLKSLRVRSDGRKRSAPEPEVGMLDEIPSTWRAVVLDLLIDRIEAGKSFSALGRAANPDEWGVLKVSAMSWGRFLQAENKAAPEGFAINAAFEVGPGDLLISRANTAELVGATVLVGETRPRLLLSDKSLRLVPHTGVDKAWLNYVLRSPLVRSQFSERATGTSDSMRNLSQSKILVTTLPLPPTDEQREIARRVDGLLALADTLQQRIAVVSARADRSSQAILARAFRGELGVNSSGVSYG